VILKIKAIWWLWRELGFSRQGQRITRGIEFDQINLSTELIYTSKCALSFAHTG
jgi:hypothetical protein